MQTNPASAGFLLPPHLQSIIHLYYIHFTGNEAATNNKVNEMKLATLIAMQVPRSHINESAVYFAQSMGDSEAAFRVDQFGDMPNNDGRLAITFSGDIIAPPVFVNAVADDIAEPITWDELMAEYDRIESGEQEDSRYVFQLPEMVKKELFLCIYIGSQYPSLFGTVKASDFDLGAVDPESYVTIKSIEVDIPLSGKVDVRTGLVEALTNKRNKLKADYYIADKSLADQIDNLQALESK